MAGKLFSNHPADVIAALKKRGVSLRALAARHNLTARALSHALYHPAERSERIIAQELLTTPAEIWPDRFNAAGERIAGRGQHWRSRRLLKSNRNQVRAAIASPKRVEA